MKTPKVSSSLEPSGAERAFVYQQAMTLSPFLQSKEPIGVVLKKNKNKAHSKYSVTFVLIPKTLNIVIESSGDDLFEVCSNAKNKAMTVIKELAHRMDFTERSKYVGYLKKFPYLH